jgi:hypothetical protein
MSKQINVSLYVIDHFIQYVQNKTITLTDCLILSYIWQFSIRDKPCYARNKSIAEKIGASPRTIEKNIQKLVDKGFLRKNRVKNLTQREIYIAWESFDIDPSTDLDYYKQKYTKDTGDQTWYSKKDADQSTSNENQSTSPSKDKNNSSTGSNSSSQDHTAQSDSGDENQPSESTSMTGTSSLTSSSSTTPTKNLSPLNGLSKGLTNGTPATSAHFFQKCSTVLYTSLPHRIKSARGAKVSTWDQHFRKLHEVDGVPKKTIKKVLKWYVRVQTNKFIPSAPTAEKFRKKFDDIVLAYERNNGEHPSDSTASGTTLKKSGNSSSKNAKRVLKRLQTTENPIYDEDLIPFVEEALENYEKLKEELPGFEKAIENTWAGPTDFAHTWFRYWLDRYANWDQWSKEATTLRCKWKSDKFCDWVEMKLKGYTDRKVRWKR